MTSCTSITVTGYGMTESKFCSYRYKYYFLFRLSNYIHLAVSPIVGMQNVDDLKIAPNTVGLLAPNTQALVLDSEDKGETLFLSLSFV